MKGDQICKCQPSYFSVFSRTLKFSKSLDTFLGGLKDRAVKHDSTQKRKNPKAQKMENELSYKIIGAAIEVQNNFSHI